MTQHNHKKHFSPANADTNHPHLGQSGGVDRPVMVGFVLLENFSMVAFTGAVDALVTSNLVQTDNLFDYRTFGLESLTVTSDLGIEISTSFKVEDHVEAERIPFDVIIVCGGYRCQLGEYSKLSEFLRHCHRQGLYLGGLWNGAISLAHAGVLDNARIAVHSDNHPYVKEHFQDISIASETSIFDGRIVTGAGPMSALSMMLLLVEHFQGNRIARAVTEILRCDQLSETSVQPLQEPTDDKHYPDSLRKVLELMRNNIEEPLTLEELIHYASISRRQLERLFQTNLETSPSRYYLELRITYARRLLQQTNKPIIEVAIASGFVSSSHFSNCFKDYFGSAPSNFRKKSLKKPSN
ncbi:GlxA family transcriptional regulator [Marinomonas piezotolerans]|uniref:GlxA family transcriptional regulator n=1 Tax=Marinomonas piezotolerans TaxID=2213058 RepID=A0A370U9M1_9GAMM|nr:GlxA family transcriptional regulator [Marinomonas piezotolerans]RDL44448.1 GlxA family transcriptional regulator [Marinomonas piezotolerans]